MYIRTPYLGRVFEHHDVDLGHVVEFWGCREEIHRLPPLFILLLLRQIQQIIEHQT